MTNPDIMPLRHQIDPRICPPDHTVDWQSPAMSTAEVALINHTHGLISGFVQGPEEVRTVVGLRTLRELEGREKITNAAPNEAELTFATAVSNKKAELDDGLRSRIDNLRFSEQQAEIVPAILDQYSGEFAYPEGVIEDLGELAAERAIHTQATREGIFSNLDWELFMAIDGLLAARRFGGKSPLISLELEGDESELGRLAGLHRDIDGNTFLEIRRDSPNCRRRISHDSVRGLNVMGFKEPMPRQPETPASKKGLLARLRP